MSKLRHCVLLLVGLQNLAKMRCCNTNFCIEIGKSPLQHISAAKSEAGACLAVCLKYQRFQPKRAYKLRAYNKNVQCPTLLKCTTTINEYITSYKTYHSTISTRSTNSPLARYIVTFNVKNLKNKITKKLTSCPLIRKSCHRKVISCDFVWSCHGRNRRE